MCPAWLLAAVLVVGVARGAVGQCWEHLSCREPNSESSIKQECIQLCRSDLTAETPVVPGNAHLQPLPPPSDPSSSSSSSSSPPPQAKRSYSMEHFRWGKPIGRKRRPVKVYTSNGVEDEYAEAFPGDTRRRALAGELLAVGGTGSDGGGGGGGGRRGEPPDWQQTLRRLHEELGRAQPEAADHALQERHQQRRDAAQVREEERGSLSLARGTSLADDGLVDQ
ncbi:hypothetical protein PFLUV_G00269500 [Perca fluviatilis]|uniref:Uncharacterized protein n=1 Tax=Perca fluviatilis TaxID=8168 RepID=A0A6A5E108_PERFL|nr:hypothetical protein PFLUV_G00269500 [Perca fluviatilis]